MSKLNYSGSFQSEASAFTQFDGVIINHLNSIANGVSQLNASWNDDVSAKYLTSFNNCLTEVKGALDKCHDEINRYFQDIKGVLGGANIEFPQLGGIALGEIRASSTDGSRLFDDDQVVAALGTMNKTADAIINDCDSFRPSVVALSGSTDDIIGAVQSNLDAGARSYDLVKEPIAKVISIIKDVQAIYAGKIGAIIGSAQ